MSDFIRDKKSKALFFCNKPKADEILERRVLKQEINALKSEINRLKQIVEDLLTKRT
jgi:hypothetical protein